MWNECGSGLSAAMNMDKPKESPHSSNLRLHRLRDAPATFFITKNVHPKKPVLDADLRRVVSSAFAFAVSRKRIIVRAYVVMPDHWHAVFGLLGDWTLPRFMHAFMSYVAGKAHAALTKAGCEWQKGYYDTRVRSSKQLNFVTRYILSNPVRKGLTDRIEDWDASSAKCPELVTDPWPWVLEKD